jgi:hypothetical protein
MFQMFDNVLLLADGKIAYYGKASKVIPYFSSLGYQCTPHYNPADYMRTGSLSVFFCLPSALAIGRNLCFAKFNVNNIITNDSSGYYYYH